MTTNIKREFFYGARALLRDNWLCRRMVKGLRSHEIFGNGEIHLLQNRFLHRTLQTAIRTLPYYSNIRLDFSVHEALGALQELFPIIEKSTLIENSSQLYPNNGSAAIWQSIGKTSGTTGSPLQVFRSPQSVLYENSFIRRHWNWFGFQDGMKRVSLRGDMVVPLSQSKPPFWFFNRYNNQLLISSRHLKEEYFERIIEELARFSPVLIQAYPSTVFALVQYMSRKNCYIDIPYVFTASEPLYSHQRDLIETHLRCQVKDMYGMAERVAFATECEFGEMHINSDYSYVEIVDDHGKPTDDYGSIVGTTFHNLTMPLIRYKLSDRTRWKQGSCRCGRFFPMIESVTGKLEDAIYGSDGSFVSPSILTFAFKGVENILKSQVAQITDEEWEIRLVPGPRFSLADQERLIENIHGLVDSEISAKVILKADIPNTASGKFRWVVNERPRHE